MAATVLTTSEVAEKLGTDPRTLRKFFRSKACTVEPVGQGKRYGIASTEIKTLRKQFDAWGKAAAETKTDAPAKPKTRKAKTTAPVLVEDDEDNEDNEGVELIDDDELESLAAEIEELEG